MICNICSVPTNWAWNTNTHQMKLETKLLSNEIPCKSKAQNTEQCKQLLDICQDNCLEQVVNEETHFTEKSKSIIDLFFTSNSSLINKVEHGW
jgi:hypothetical protein